MAMVEFENGTVQIDATIIAEGLGIEPSLVLTSMREGKITSRYDRGIDEDAGRHRLTFFSEGRRLSVIVDRAGNVVRRSVVDYGDRPAPPGLHRPFPRSPTRKPKDDH